MRMEELIMSNQPNTTNVTTGQVRLSYVHLAQPYASKPGQEAKYSVTLLIPKSDIAAKQRIDAAIQTAIQAGIPKVWGGTRPPLLNIPIHDGDGPRPSDGMPFGDECRGHWVMSASSKQQQAIVDLSMNPIIDQTEIYSGMYARVNVNFYAYNNTKKGVGCGLGPIQKIADGEPLGGGRVSPEEAFGDGFNPGYQAPAYQQPAYPGQPPVQPGYAQPGQPMQPTQPNYAQPNYPAAGQQPGYQAPAQPGYQQPQQIDPITGKPVTGGIMGL